MYRIYIKRITFFIVGFLSIAIGLLFIANPVILYKKLITLFSIFIFISGISLLIRGLFNRKEELKIGKSFVNIFLGFSMLLFPDFPLPLLPLLFAFYLLINTGIQIAYYFFLRQNEVQGRLKEMGKATGYFLLALPFLFAPTINLKYMLMIVGIYLVFYGITSIFDFIEEFIPKKQRELQNRRFHLSLPVFVTAFVPYSILKEMNGSTIEQRKQRLKSFKKNSDDYNLEVFVHVSEGGFGTVGHIDLWFEGHVISYGNYDMHSRKLKEAIGDGVLFTCDDKQKYLHFCQEHSKKLLFGFGLRLDEKRLAAVRSELNKLKENVYEWIPYYKRAVENKEEIQEGMYEDYASVLYKMTGAKFYKFKTGKFKTFFILSTNCVALADQILGAAGTDIIKLSGFIAPGSYYDYLYREYCKKNSMVVSYQVYIGGDKDADSSSSISAHLS